MGLLYLGLCKTCSISLSQDNAARLGIRNGKQRYRKMCKKCNSKSVIARACLDIPKRRAKLTTWLRKSGKVRMYACEKCGTPCYKHYKKAFCSDKCRFLSYVTITDSCWFWNGCKNKRGYGMLSFRKRSTFPAHRVSYILFRGEIPESKCVCHTCDITYCVNPNHLWLGTTQENTEDMVKKGRSLKGERHLKAKLTEQDVLKIRELANSGIKQIKISKMFNVMANQINAIVKRKAWKHV